MAATPRHGSGTRVAVALALLAACIIFVLSALGSHDPRSPDQRADVVTTLLGDELSLDGRVSLLVDPSRALTLADVLKMGSDFAPIRGHDVSLGYTYNAAWMRIRLEKPLTTPMLLSLSPNFVDFIDVYLAQNRPGLQATDFRHIAMGDHRPLPDDPISGLDNAVSLPLSAEGGILIYVRIASVNSSLNISASVFPETKHTIRVTITSLLSGAWFGGMLVLFAIQLVFFHFDRKPSYLLLGMSILGATMVYAGNLGISRLFMFPGGGYGNDRFLAAAVWFGFFSSSLAMVNILELAKYAPWSRRFILLGAGLGVVGMGFAVCDRNLLFANFGHSYILVMVTLAMGLGLRFAENDGVSSRLRGAAYLILWIGAVATVLQRAGVWVVPNWIAHSYAVSSLIQTLLLTGAMAVRLRTAESMNQAMREQALLAAKAAERRATDMVEEKTHELAAAKKVAEDALRAELSSQQQQVRFMEVISHQYRTPLAAIRSNVDSIGISLPPSDTANRGRIDRIRRAILRLVETLEVNLTRSRMQGPAFAPDLVRIPLCEPARAAVARARDMLQGEILVEAEPPAEQEEILGDAEMLGIAIINLLENAVKFSALTGGAPVKVTCRVVDGAGMIAVSDKGIGIPADEIASILGRSVRGSNARSIEGSGIGLSLVSRIAEAHGGSIEVDSGKGQGTTIRMILPLLPRTGMDLRESVHQAAK